MGDYVIKMPDIGEGIAEVEVVEWHIEVGDTVQEDQVIADVMTDKATVQVPSPVTGKVLALGGRVGEILPVGAELLRLEVEGQGNAAADAAALPHPDGASTPVESLTPTTPAPSTPPPPASPTSAPPTSAPPTSAPPSLASPTSASPTSASPTSTPSRPSTQATSSRTTSRLPTERPLASPSVRRRAMEEGVDLRQVPASGPVGQVTHEDL